MGCSVYRIKRAETETEFEQIFRLNQRIFADDLRQYSAGSGGPGEQFHAKNQYWSARAEDSVVGMIALHDEPPFSVADKLRDPSVLSSLGRLAEIRLLAIDPAHRNRMLLAGLLVSVFGHARNY